MEPDKENRVSSLSTEPDRRWPRHTAGGVALPLPGGVAMMRDGRRESRFAARLAGRRHRIFAGDISRRGRSGHEAVTILRTFRRQRASIRAGSFR